MLVIAQKIMSKAEGRYIELRDVVPLSVPSNLRRASQKDPRLVEVILSESQEIVRYREGRVDRHSSAGVRMANAGVDQSNIDHPGRKGTPPAAARRILTLRAPC